ncbi:uncharacterized protein LOC131666357 isoform X2 [Phymastichus coffea]|uniref:uncharacterized protein LOC131666357 isoform X2 n=1 Tax=Phymastichus coffea TaxID=108790 RepID=UPI00273CC2FF|nr:uncharacterized protein LOC131666357 isoform X2 [Phymastichus coffea]
MVISRTNLPKEIMSFPDFPVMKGEHKSCVSHQTVLNYLKDYARRFNLRQYIELNTLVESVQLVPSTEQCHSEKWKVKVRNIKSRETKEEVFDAIIVCNGHYFEPYIPSIPGISNFHGQIIHSHKYRTAEAFSGKTVILLGASSSGIDIAFELSGHASQVYLSHNKERLANERNCLGFNEVRGVEKYEDKAFVLRDGERIGNVDVLLLCTGYQFVYPFLEASCDIRVDDNYVSPLYKHLINVEHPTMCLLGVPMLVVPFPLFHVQIQYFLALLKEEARLPSKAVMLEDAKLKTPKKRHAHKLSSAQWAYNDELASAGNFEGLPPYYRLGYEAWRQKAMSNLKHYKQFNLVVEADKLSVRIAE